MSGQHYELLIHVAVPAWLFCSPINFGVVASVVLTDINIYSNLYLMFS
jgi:hypothetical protein